MSNLAFSERRVLEQLFRMGGGVVLDFTNTTFSEFFRLDFSVEIYGNKYEGHGDSKAKRLRGFWDVEDDHLVGRVTHALIDLCEATSDTSLVKRGRDIADRLVAAAPLDNIEELSIDFSDGLLSRFAESTRKLIAAGAYSDAVDRMHTTIVLYLRRICQDRGIVFTDKEPLQNLAGKYVKHVVSTSELETEMSERIIKSSISILERFNPVRNERSMAHPNQPVGDAEAKFIVSSVLAMLRFFRSIERTRKASEKQDDEWDVPF